MAKTSSNTVSALDFLLAPNEKALGPIVVVAGDEPFLKREVLNRVRESLCADDDLACTMLAGRETEWRDVLDSLGSVSLFGGASAVIVEESDTFVTRYRTQLEDYAARDRHAGTLTLDVKSWPGNTRLAKAAAAKGLTIKCGVPDRGAELNQFIRSAKKWLEHRGREVHGCTLSPAAADALFDLLPLSLGVMDQEVAKLSLLVEPGGAIQPELAHQHVGGWRVRKAWDMIDAAADGDAAGALSQLDSLLRAGEQPIGLLAQLASSLRRLSSAACLIEQAEARGQRVSLRDALEQAGAMKFKLGDAERQLKQIGRARASRLDQWLLDADLALKGHNSTPAKARMELERLVARLSRAADLRRSKPAPQRA